MSRHSHFLFQHFVSAQLVRPARTRSLQLSGSSSSQSEGENPNRELSWGLWRIGHRRHTAFGLGFGLGERGEKLLKIESGSIEKRRRHSRRDFAPSLSSPAATNRMPCRLCREVAWNSPLLNGTISCFSVTAGLPSEVYIPPSFPPVFRLNAALVARGRPGRPRPARDLEIQREKRMNGRTDGRIRSDFLHYIISPNATSISKDERDERGRTAISLSNP